MARTSTRTATKRGPKLESKISGQSGDRKSITEPPEERPNISTLPKQDEGDGDDATGEEEHPFQAHGDTQGGGGGRDMRHRTERGQGGADGANSAQGTGPYVMVGLAAVLSLIAIYVLS